LDALGPEALTGRELVALLVGSGGRRASALGIADDVLASVAGSLRTLGSVSPSVIAAIPGVGMAEIRHPGDRVRGPRDVFDRMEPRLRDLPQEEFHALLLSARHSVIREVFITRGILDASLIHPREVFRPAITQSAAAIILVHNHPSGDPTPSAEDRAVTKQLSAVGRTVGIGIVDHVVIGDGRFVSLADNGGLE